MIRRAFWLGAGAAAGIMGYRRVCAVGRKVHGTVAGASGKSGKSGKSAFGMAREAVRFSRDVREGMDLYMARHNGPGASTLRAHHELDQKDGH